MLLLIIGLLLFIGLVVVHEFGHFIMARRSGVMVEEFGIGFPPRLYKHKTKGGWLFTINLLPLGGFVRTVGVFVDATQRQHDLPSCQVGSPARVFQPLVRVL